jgi:UDP-glucose 6-dehydrogenase
MDTLRETPSLDTIPILLDDRAIIKTWDPVAIHHVKEKFDNTLIYCETIERF